MDTEDDFATTGADGLGNEIYAMDGNPDLGTTRIVQQIDSDIEALDRSGAHSVPWMDYKTPDAEVANYNVTLEGSVASTNDALAGYQMEPEDNTAADESEPTGADALSALVAGDADSLQVVRWEALTLNQQRVLTSAMEGEPLSFLVLSWASSEDRQYNGGANNRGRPYAEALIPAALDLIRAGVVGVAPVGASSRVLPQTAALEVVGDLGNWWRYKNLDNLNDPIGSGPSDPIAPPGWISPYVLVQVNRERFTISAWEWPPRMPAIRFVHESLR